MRIDSIEHPVKSDCYSSLKAALAEFEQFRVGTNSSTVCVPLDLQAQDSTEPLTRVRAVAAAFDALERWESEWRDLWSPGMLVDRPALFIRDGLMHPPFNMASLHLGFARKELEEYPLDSFIGFSRAEPGDPLLATQARLNHSLAYRHSDQSAPGWIFRGDKPIDIVRIRVLKHLAVEENVDRIALLTHLSAALSSEARAIALQGRGPIHVQMLRLKTLAELQYLVSAQLARLMYPGAAAVGERGRLHSLIEELFQLARAQRCEHEFSSAIEWGIAKAGDRSAAI